MFLFNVFVINSIVFYSDFVHSHTGSEYLRIHYGSYIQNQDKETPKHEICFTSVIRWATACESALQQLRKSEMYKNSLFVNYQAFRNVKSPNCIQKTFGFDQKLVGTHWMLSCYGREAIVEDEVPPNKYKYYEEIFIYPVSKPEVQPGNETSMMIFQFNQSRDMAILINVYGDMPWKSLTLISSELFNSVPPMSITNKNKINEHLNKKRKFIIDSFLLHVNGNCFTHLCNQFYDRPKYKYEVAPMRGTYKYSAFPKPDQERLITTDGHHLAAYACTLYNVKTSNQQTKDFKVAIAPDKNTVILIQSQSGTKRKDHVILEIIINLFDDLFDHTI